MTLGLKSFVLCASFCLSSGLIFAQGATCASDGEQPAQGAAIACVTGAGVQVQSASEGQGQGLGIVPLTPEQMPANPPLVTYVNGKLSIVAKNSTLSDILRVVGEKTGAVIDLPEGADERVVSQLGPGPAREVIASLLNGSHFNYVMVGNETDASAVARVVLTAKSDGKTPPAGAPGSVNAPTMAGAFRPYVQPRTALQRAVMQPYQELQEQQRAQEVNTPSFQPAIANEETPAPVEPESTPQPSGVPTAGIPSTNGPAAIAPATPAIAGTETAAVDPSLPTNEGGASKGANASGERSAQQMLQDLYETRRQMMQQQRQPAPQQ
jgi:hypothetical protein